MTEGHMITKRCQLETWHDQEKAFCDEVWNTITIDQRVDICNFIEEMMDGSNYPGHRIAGRLARMAFVDIMLRTGEGDTIQEIMR